MYIQCFILALYKSVEFNRQCTYNVLYWPYTKVLSLIDNDVLKGNHTS